MKRLIRTIATALMFIRIFTGYLAALLLVTLIARLPPLLIAVFVACWIYEKQKIRPAI